MNLPKNQQEKSRFRLSLRYKVALPVLVFVTVMLFTLFRTTFRFVRELVLERTESRLEAVAEVFGESLKVPLVLSNQEVLEATLQWMAARSDVIEVRVEDTQGSVIGSTSLETIKLPDPIRIHKYRGVQRLSQDRYGVAVGIDVGDNPLGRLVIIFSQLGLEGELRQIFVERMLLAFSMGAVLALMTSIVTWLAVRPLIRLKTTAEQILGGNLEARAEIHSFDEIEDLAGAFNEMVSRLARSLDSLRARSQALEDSEEKYRLIVDNASDIIFALTPAGEIVFLNEGFSGCTREEILDGGLELFRELHDADSLAEFEKALETVQETKDSVINVPTTHVHRGNQSEIFFLTSFTPLIDHDGRVKLIQGVMRDVTEMRRIEIMKESLIRDVAHELKTPTAKFEMAVHWFEKEMKTNEALRSYAPVIEMMKNNTDRLMRTITSVMDLSKLESGMQVIDRKRIDLNELLRQVLADMEPLCSQKSLVLQSCLSEETLYIEGDRDMLYRLFVNLITNATKYTPKGHIKVTSALRDGHVTAEVEDTGIGIEEKDLKTIFDRFVQKTASSVGIGVGLTISRDIAILHHARIWAESEGLGKGSIFKVRF